jgi:hypothetical protein
MEGVPDVVPEGGGVDMGKRGAVGKKQMRRWPAGHHSESSAPITDG